MAHSIIGSRVADVTSSQQQQRAPASHPSTTGPTCCVVMPPARGTAIAAAFDIPAADAENCHQNRHLTAGGVHTGAAYPSRSEGHCGPTALIAATSKQLPVMAHLNVNTAGAANGGGTSRGDPCHHRQPAVVHRQLAALPAAPPVLFHQKLAEVVDILWNGVIRDYPAVVTTRPPTWAIHRVGLVATSPQTARNRKIVPSGQQPMEAGTPQITVVATDHPRMTVATVTSHTCYRSVSNEPVAYILAAYYFFCIAVEERRRSDLRALAAARLSADQQHQGPVPPPRATVSTAPSGAGGSIASRFRVYQFHQSRLFLALVTIAHKMHGDFDFKAKFFHDLLPDVFRQDLTKAVSLSGIASSAYSTAVDPPAFAVPSLEVPSILHLEWQAGAAIDYHFSVDRAHLSAFLTTYLSPQDLRFVVEVNEKQTSWEKEMDERSERRR